MCGLCGVLLNEHWAEEGGGRRARGFRVVLLNRVLSHYGLSLSDWAGSVYTLRDGKGRSAVVTDVGMLWSEAEKLAGRPVDPLDPALLATIRAAGTDGNGIGERLESVPDSTSSSTHP